MDLLPLTLTDKWQIRPLVRDGAPYKTGQQLSNKNQYLGLDTKTDRLTDRQSQCDSDSGKHCVSTLSVITCLISVIWLMWPEVTRPLATGCRLNDRSSNFDNGVCNFLFIGSIPQWSHWIFQLTKSFQPYYGPGVDSVSNINEYQESSWG
jgi:hypothetical protein